MSLKKIFLTIALFLVISFFGFSSVNAMTETERQTLIAQIIQQIATLQTQLNQMLAVQGQNPSTSSAWCHTFNTNLRIGDTGDEVQNLQVALEKESLLNESDIYSDGGGAMNQNYQTAFGDHTASAVVSFQQKYASEILTPNGLTNGNGYVGPATRRKLNQLYGCSLAVLAPVVTPTPVPITTPVITPIPISDVAPVTPAPAPVSQVSVSPSPVIPTSAPAPVTPPNSGKTQQLSSNSLPLRIIVTSPNSGNFSAGDEVPISFTTSGLVGKTIRITLYNLDTNNDYTFGDDIIIKQDGVQNISKQIWHDAPLGNKYRFGIEETVCSMGNPSCFTPSFSGIFSISSVIPPSITITSPNGGEVWRKGEIHNITWNSKFIFQQVRFSVIDYSSSSPVEYSIRDCDADNGSYAWKVGDLPVNWRRNAITGLIDQDYVIKPGNKFKIRVSECYGNTLDFSDNYFTIDDIVRPSIISLSASSTARGSSVTISGTNLNAKTTVVLYSIDHATNITNVCILNGCLRDQSNTSLTFTVPQNISAETYYVVARDWTYDTWLGTTDSNELPLIVTSTTP